MGKMVLPAQKKKKKKKEQEFSCLTSNSLSIAAIMYRFNHTDS